MNWLAGGFFPYISVPFFEPTLKVPTYFLGISAISIVTVIQTRYLSQRLGIQKKPALDLLLALMIGGFLGSRILHIVWEEPNYYLENPMRVFEFWQGGFVWYGGVFGALALAFAAHRLSSKVSFLSAVSARTMTAWLNFFAPIAALSYGMGRLICWLVGCCYGRTCDWFSLQHFVFPTQLFAFFWETLLAGFLLRSALKGRTQNLVWYWLLFHSLGRILMEQMRGDDRGLVWRTGPFEVSLATSISVFIFLLSFQRVTATLLKRRN